eukprot:gene10801-biopygen7721
MPPIMSGGNWIAAGLAIGLFLLLLALLLLLLVPVCIRCCCTPVYLQCVPSDDRDAMTVAVFWFDECVGACDGMDEVRAACRLRKDLERIVHDAMSEHLVYETDNSCGAIVGVTADAMAAVQCSLDVKKAVSELNPRDYAAPVALDSDSSRVPPAAAAVRDIGIRVGLATGLCTREVVQEGRWAVTKFRGRCVTEATQIATGVAGPRIAASESTWYALSELQGRSVSSTWVEAHMWDISSLQYVQHTSCWRDIYIITGRQNPNQAAGEMSNSTIIVHNPYKMIRMYFAKMPTEPRITRMLSITELSGGRVPAEKEGKTREQYASVLVRYVAELVLSGAENAMEATGLIDDDVESQTFE